MPRRWQGHPPAGSEANPMKAAICTKYGPPNNVTLSELPTPVPASHEILVRIHATTVSSGDCRMRGANFPPGFTTVARLALGWSGPRQPILGTECAGTVVAVGPQVSRYRAGDEVFAFTGARFGCHAEYIAIPEDGAIAAKPASLLGINLSFCRRCNPGSQTSRPIGLETSSAASPFVKTQLNSGYQILTRSDSGR